MYFRSTHKNMFVNLSFCCYCCLYVGQNRRRQANSLSLPLHNNHHLRPSTTTGFSTRQPLIVLSFFLYHITLCFFFSLSLSNNQVNILGPASFYCSGYLVVVSFPSAFVLFSSFFLLCMMLMRGVKYRKMALFF